MSYKFLITIFISGFISSSFCQNLMAKDKEYPFLRDGISLSIEDGWKITANDSIGENAFYISAERTGNKATGLISITWINKVEDPGKMVEMHQKSMKTANIYRNPGIEFTAVENDKFAGLEVKSCHYITFVKEQKLEGRIYSFNVSQKTITIFTQTGLEDRKINQKGFDLLQRTFRCRE
jgi:hypothetical protein